MKMRDASLSDLTADDPPDHVDLAEVDRLILDLSALVEAGLVAVQEPLFGPARYGVSTSGMRADCA